MGLPQPKKLHGIGAKEKTLTSPSQEPARPIKSLQGEVAAMQSLIASRMTQGYEDQSPPQAGDMIEMAISKISRWSGYIAMGAALIGIAFLIF